MPPGIIVLFSGQDPIPTGLSAGFLPETPRVKPRWKTRPSDIMLTPGIPGIVAWCMIPSIRLWERMS
jgi:hypothetical protein